MNSGEARRLFAEYSNAVAFVDVEDDSGNRSVGSSFHIGEGVFVTARHVVENKRILEVRITESVPVGTEEWFREIMKVDVSDEMIKKQDQAIIDAVGHTIPYAHRLEALEVVDGPYFLENENLDLAVFRVSDIHHAAGIVKLGVHWDDWVYRNIWSLSDAVVLGYPPIPMTSEPTLIAARAEIHTYVVPRHAPSIHFLLSAMPRGGFSGGVAIHESGDALGVITSSLTHDGAPAELGFLAVLSIEAIYKCLKLHGMYPNVQQQHHDRVLGLNKNET